MRLPYSPSPLSLLGRSRHHLLLSVDGPNHFMPGEGIPGVESLDLGVMNGPCYVTPLMDVEAIDAAALEALPVPKGVTRLVLKTRNTKRNLMNTRAFAYDYCALTACGAKYLVEETDVDFVAIDYLSVAKFEDLQAAHQNLLGKLERTVTILEGVVRNDVEEGAYEIMCLPMYLVGSDGAPCRAALIR